jgi:hypothetical protein
MDVPNLDLEVTIIRDENIVIAPSKDGPLVIVPVVKSPRVVALQIVDEAMKLSTGALNYEVVMISHQAVGVDAHTGFFASSLD